MSKVQARLIVLVALLSQSVPRAFADVAPDFPLGSSAALALPAFLLIGSIIMFAAWLKAPRAADGSNPRKVLAIGSAACLVLSMVMVGISMLGYIDDSRKQDEYHASRQAILAREKMQEQIASRPAELANKGHWAFQTAMGKEKDAKAKQAIELYDQSEKLDPAQLSGEAHLERGTAHLYLKQYEPALKDLLAASAQGEQCRAGIAEAYLGLKQYKKALENANLAEKENGYYYYNYKLTRGMANHGLGRDREALKELNAMDAKREATQDVIYSRYRIYADMGNTAMALKDLKHLKQWHAPLETADLAYLKKYDAN